MSIRRSLPRVALTLPLAAMAAWAIFHREQINLATLDAWLASLGPWTPVGHMMLFALATVAFVPGVVFSLAGGSLVRPTLGQRMESHRRYARRYACILGCALRRRGLGRAQGRRAS